MFPRNGVFIKRRFIRTMKKDEERTTRHTVNDCISCTVTKSAFAAVFHEISLNSSASASSIHLRTWSNFSSR